MAEIKIKFTYKYSVMIEVSYHNAETFVTETKKQFPYGISLISSVPLSSKGRGKRVYQVNMVESILSFALIHLSKYGDIGKVQNSETMGFRVFEGPLDQILTIEEEIQEIDPTTIVKIIT